MKTRKNALEWTGRNRPVRFLPGNAGSDCVRYRSENTEGRRVGFGDSPLPIAAVSIFREREVSSCERESRRTKPQRSVFYGLLRFLESPNSAERRFRVHDALCVLVFADGLSESHPADFGRRKPKPTPWCRRIMQHPALALFPGRRRAQTTTPRCRFGFSGCAGSEIAKCAVRPKHRQSTEIH